MKAEMLKRMLSQSIVEMFPASGIDHGGDFGRTEAPGGVNLVMMGEASKIPARDVTVAKFLGRIDGAASSSLSLQPSITLLSLSGPSIIVV
jgi:hypothetical protein